MTAALVIKRRELLEEAERCCQELANHTVVEKNDCTNWSTFLEWLGQLQPQVLLIDVEHFQNIVEERVRQIKVASPETMIIALHDAADSQLISPPKVDAEEPRWRAISPPNSESGCTRRALITSCWPTWT